MLEYRLAYSKNYFAAIGKKNFFKVGLNVRNFLIRDTRDITRTLMILFCSLSSFELFFSVVAVVPIGFKVYR